MGENKNGAGEQSGVNKETYMGTIPILKSERIYSFPDVTLAAAGFGIASWCYVQGAWIASIEDFGTAMITCVVPVLLASLVLMTLVIIPARYGVDLWMYQRAVFGHRLAFGLCMVALLLTWGWYAINCGVFSDAVIQLAALGGLDLSAYAKVFSIACAVIGFLIALKGPYLVKIATYVMVPALILTGIILVIKLTSITNFEELMSYTPVNQGDYPDPKTAYLVLTEGMMAFVFGWYPALGGLSRLTKTEKSAYWGHVLGYGISMFVFIIIGCVCSTLIGGRFGYYSSNPAEWMAVLCGPVWAVIAIITIALANVSTQMMGVYCLSIALKVFKPKWSYKLIALGLSAFCVLLLLWDGIWTYYNVFLAVISISAAPACGIIFADFFLLRKDRFSLRACFGRDDNYSYTHGFNLAALLALLVGIALYLFTYNPLTSEVHSFTLMKLTPTIASFLLAGLVYCLLSRIKRVRAYLLK